MMIDVSSKKPNRVTLSRRRSLPYRNQSIDLQSKSVDWFLYNRHLHRDIGKTGVNTFLSFEKVKLYLRAKKVSSISWYWRQGFLRSPSYRLQILQKDMLKKGLRWEITGVASKAQKREWNGWFSRNLKSTI